MKKVLPYIFIAFFISCDENAGTTDSNDNLKFAVDSSFLNFDENLAYKYIEKQVSFGPRNPGSSGHKQCASWLLNTLKEKSHGC